MDALTKAQAEYMRIARIRGWITPGTANEIRTADALVKRGLLEPHPEYERSLRPTEAA